MFADHEYPGLVKRLEFRKVLFLSEGWCDRLDLNQHTLASTSPFYYYSSQGNINAKKRRKTPLKRAQKLLETHSDDDEPKKTRTSIASLRRY